ncbi:hypothetical protein WJX73_000328 [Symbiochloris irregularis]|uniref:Fumarylacetoacetase n=1 Tax=Symbiochloris irregularis TaxID=706552 RepID=A0AAW1P363_9CHLO
MATSWLAVDPGCSFTLQNLPYGVFSHSAGQPRIGTAIGSNILDLAVLQSKGLFQGPHLRQSDCFSQTTLNAFMALGRPAWTEARARIQALLRADEPALRDNEELRKAALISQSKAIMHLPANIPDYTDFYASREHATTCGTILRGKENALMPNWLHIPIAYHGRSSSIVVSGTPVRRPRGQLNPDSNAQPHTAACKWLDFELEMAAFIGGPPNALGQPVSTAEAADRLFGLVLMNDWSARDIQKWEGQPLGPFTAKNWATSISPWVVTFDALQPFRCEAPGQEATSPQVQAYLQEPDRHSFNIQLSVEITPLGNTTPTVITRSNFKHLYWTLEQMVAHHSVTGCPMRPGDLLATGTISCDGELGQGSLLEQTMGGKQAVELEGGEKRTFLQDGDTVTMRGWCEAGGVGLGFGSCTGQVVSAHP